MSIKPFSVREPGSKWVLVWAENEKQAVRNYLDEKYPAGPNETAWNIKENDKCNLKH